MLCFSECVTIYSLQKVSVRFLHLQIYSVEFGWKLILGKYAINLLWLYCFAWSRVNLVSTATRYGVDGPEFESRHGKGFFVLPYRSSRLWGPPGLLRNGCRSALLGQSGYLLLRLRMSGVIPLIPPPVCLHDMDRVNFALLLPFFHHQPNIISSLYKA